MVPIAQLPFATEPLIPRLGMGLSYINAPAIHFLKQVIVRDVSQVGRDQTNLQLVSRASHIYPRRMALFLVWLNRTLVTQVVPLPAHQTNDGSRVRFEHAQIRTTSALEPLDLLMLVIPLLILLYQELFLVQ
ncbi:hypothetical protein D3C78_981410 [compost metagenome]